MFGGKVRIPTSESARRVNWATSEHGKHISVGFNVAQQYRTSRVLCPIKMLTELFVQRSFVLSSDLVISLLPRPYWSRNTRMTGLSSDSMAQLEITRDCGINVALPLEAAPLLLIFDVVVICFYMPLPTFPTWNLQISRHSVSELSQLNCVKFKKKHGNHRCLVVLDFR